MAKVMISIPDALLARLDEEARRSGTTRSGLLRALAERELRAQDVDRKDEIAALLARPRGHGGRGAAYVRELRRSR